MVLIIPQLSSNSMSWYGIDPKSGDDIVTAGGFLYHKPASVIVID